jgi:hypothetical protein
MSTSVSSEHAFSAAGITIIKWHNQLGGDIVKALQFLKYFYQCNLLFCEADNPSIASETQLDGQIMLKDDSNQLNGSWDELVVDINTEPFSILDMQGNDDDVTIAQLN